MKSQYYLIFNTMSLRDAVGYNSPQIPCLLSFPRLGAIQDSILFNPYLGREEMYSVECMCVRMC